MKKFRKIIGMIVICLCYITIFKNVEATTITAASSVEKGKSVTITVTVPNVNTVDLTATVSGAGTSGTIRIVDGSMTGDAKDFSKSITVTPTTTGTINVSVSSNSNAVLNRQYVNVSASKTITVTEPVSSNTNTSNSSSNNNTNNNNTNNTAVTKKSSNANLKNMILSVEGLSPAFAKNITSYSVSVGENVNEIKVSATVEHSKAIYSVYGNTNLKVGENLISVKVTAEDGTVKTYKINVLKSDDPVKSDATLSSVIIEDVNLGQEFDPNVTEYNAGDITVKEDKLNIYAYPTNDNAKVEILGNENLVIGENKITIRVTSENGKITKDYVVLFNKVYEEEKSNNIDIYQDILQTSNNKKSFLQVLRNWYEANLKEHVTVIILYVFVWIEFIQVVYLYERLKKYEDLDKVTVGKRINREKVKEDKEKLERIRRTKQNPVFPEDEVEKED